MTHQQLFLMPLDEFHTVIAKAYASAIKLRRQAVVFENDAKNPRYSDFYNLKKYSEHMAEIKYKTAQRIENWARKCVTLKYQTL